MGNCIGARHQNRNRSTGEHSSHSNRDHCGPGKNLPLRHEKIRWKSDQPLTEGQVRSKRDEFWDTAPAFEGRKEIWDALKAAASAVENIDYDLAQAIIDGASITLPNGTLTDCYDELGTRYQLPVYCLSMPINIVHQSDSILENEGIDGNNENGEESELKVRLSTTLKDVKLIVRSTDTISTAKQKLEMQEHLGLCRQRWYYGGKLLGDRLHVHECNIKPNWVVQCILTENTITPIDT
ncbi:UNVERIFIED_CONTAM: hypothetical protein RMT77_006991 [Armadillidium vulgare]